MVFVPTTKLILKGHFCSLVGNLRNLLQQLQREEPDLQASEKIAFDE